MKLDSKTQQEQLVNLLQAVPIQVTPSNIVEVAETINELMIAVKTATILPDSDA